MTPGGTMVKKRWMYLWIPLAASCHVMALIQHQWKGSGWGSKHIYMKGNQSIIQSKSIWTYCFLLRFNCKKSNRIIYIVWSLLYYSGMIKQLENLQWSKLNKSLDETYHNILALADLILALPATSVICEQGLSELKVVSNLLNILGRYFRNYI